MADTLRRGHPHWQALTPPSSLAEIKAADPRPRPPPANPAGRRFPAAGDLETYHPAPAPLFASVDRQITLHFVLDSPTPAAASRIKTTRMNGFPARHHYTGRVRGQVLAERLRDNLPTASPGTVAGKSHSAQSLARLLQLLNTQLAEYDDAIAAAVAGNPDTPILASLAEIGEDRALHTPAALLADGLAPVTSGSDGSRQRHQRHRRLAPRARLGQDPRPKAATLRFMASAKGSFEAETHETASSSSSCRSPAQRLGAGAAGIKACRSRAAADHPGVRVGGVRLCGVALLAGVGPSLMGVV